MFSSFRLAGVGVMAGVGLVGALFYGTINTHYLSEIISQTVGPYSDTLAEHGFASQDPDIWQRLAEGHHVGILVEPMEGDPEAFDARGRPISPAALPVGQIRAVRTRDDGTRVTLYWTVSSFPHSHFIMMGGLLLMVVAVIGSGFWFLQRQLKPLVWLHSGVEAVARGDFKTRVPIVRDDEIGQVARAFNAMTGRVAGMLDDRERMLADVSHELRSPIARMKVALEFMPEGDKRELLARDLREMESLIAVLLEREELRSRTGRLEGREVDLKALTAEVVAGCANREPGVELITAEAVNIHADPALIKLLLQNVIDNAIKFSRADSRPIRVTLEAAQDEVILRVADDGIGIPAGSEERVFEPFVKLDRARGHGVGYGIGLNLCQRIAQLHGGTIRLAPREPRGAEVIVTLPAR